MARSTWPAQNKFNRIFRTFSSHVLSFACIFWLPILCFTGYVCVHVSYFVLFQLLVFCLLSYFTFIDSLWISYHALLSHLSPSPLGPASALAKPYLNKTKFKGKAETQSKETNEN